jgi:hypothetical protein
MQVTDIISRVQAKCDDRDGTYVTDDVVMGLIPEAYDWLFNKLEIADSQFDQSVVVLPAVNPSADLSQYQADGQPLASLLQPRMVRWRLVGQTALQWRRADGPLNTPRDMVDGGYPALDSWAWSRFTIQLSTFSVPLDLEITGDFLFDQLTSPDSQIALGKNMNRALSCKVAAELGKSRGNDKWATTYSADADEAVDDVIIAMVKARQADPARVGRITRGYYNRARTGFGR